MNCSECREVLVAHVERLLEPEQERDLAEHLARCRGCQADMAKLAGLRDRLIQDGRATAGKSLVGPVMDRITEQQAMRPRRITVLRRYKWQWSAAAAAGFVLIATLLTLIASGRWGGQAYAIEQTIEANKSIRTIHLKEELPGVVRWLKKNLGPGYARIPERYVKETWAEFDEDGKVTRLRMDSPQTEDGPKFVVWQGDLAEVWMPTKSVFLTIREEGGLASLRSELFDPKQIMTRLHEAESQGQVTLEIEEPSSKSEFVRVTATWLDTHGRQGTFPSHARLLNPDTNLREVVLVDPKTRLLRRTELYELDGDKTTLISRQDVLEYNKALDPALFKLNPPDSVMRIDHTTQEIGMAQGDLTDEEIAVEVVRHFFEALIAEDYERAGQLLGGMPAARMREAYGSRARLARIISIGKAEPQPIPRVGGYVVPYEVEFDAGGARSVKKFKAAVREVHRQPGRWAIHGGI